MACSGVYHVVLNRPPFLYSYFMHSHLPYRSYWDNLHLRFEILKTLSLLLHLLFLFISMEAATFSSYFFLLLLLQTHNIDTTTTMTSVTIKQPMADGWNAHKIKSYFICWHRNKLLCRFYYENGFSYFTFFLSIFSFLHLLRLFRYNARSICVYVFSFCSDFWVLLCIHTYQYICVGVKWMLIRP